MKRVLLLVVLACLASTLSAAAVEIVAPGPAAIAEVRAGKRTIAEAAWWGFDPQDATASLQAAINSGARKVIVKNMNTPWNVNPIELASDQELVLEKGVVIQARRGGYQSKSASLLTANMKKNVRITGDGAMLRMWRSDYHRAPYEHSEWRHAIAIRGCTGVTISGVTLAESGGDGIYLGAAGKNKTNKDIVIRDVVCDRNYRQGISVITAENLLIANTILRDTSGTAPMAGIDFEPNAPGERLVNCVMKDCLAEGNTGNGYVFYLKNLNASSAPVSIRFENCRSVGNRNGFRFTTGNSEPNSCMPGQVDVINCQFTESQLAGIVVEGKPAEVCPIRFERCQVLNAARKEPLLAPIQLASNSESTLSIGGVEFVDCVVVDAADRLPLSYRDLAGGVKLSRVAGALTLERAGRRTVCSLDRKLLDEWFPFQAFKEFPPFRPAGLGWVPANPQARPERGWSCAARLRDHAEYLLYAEAGQDVKFTMGLKSVGRMGSPKMTLNLISPSGKSRALPAMTGDGEKPYAFKATETGAWRLVCDTGRATVRVVSSSHRVCIYSPSALLHLLGVSGDLYFHVPAGVKEFALRVSGAGEGESVKATVYDPAGRKVGEKDNILGHQFLLTRASGAPAEAWRLRLEKPSKSGIEDHFLRLQGIAPVLASSPQALLRIK